jgi:hypothetical protein
MSPSIGRSEQGTSKSTSQRHRYYTRSCRNKHLRNDYRHSTDERGIRRSTPKNTRKPNPLSTRQISTSPDSPSHSENDTDALDIDASQVDTAMDHITCSTSNPVHAPFPSPAIKTTQPFYPFAPSVKGNQFSHFEGQQGSSWHQNATGATCILMEAANRAQMAILMDDMGNMGIEQMEQP